MNEDRGADRADTRTRIVEAAARLLDAGGVGAVTTRAVAQEASVQAPTIYRLFGDKNGLLDAVAAHVMTTYVAGKSVTAGQDEDPVADLRAGWRLHVEFGLAHPAVYPLLIGGAGDRSGAATAGLDVLKARVRRLALAGLLRVDEPRALDMITAGGNGTILALLAVSAEQRDPGLSDAMFRAVCASILTTAPAAPDAQLGTIAVAFAAALPDLPGLTTAERALMAEWLGRALQQLRSPWVEQGSGPRRHAPHRV